MYGGSTQQSKDKEKIEYNNMQFLAKANAYCYLTNIKEDFKIEDIKLYRYTGTYSEIHKFNTIFRKIFFFYFFST